MNLFMKNIENEIDEETPSTDYEMGELNSCIAQFYVFKGEKYLGWDCFDKKRVTIGKSPEADLVLSDETISGIQASYTITADGILVSNESTHGTLSVNDKNISNSIVNPLDLVKIGQYTIKVKLKKINDEAQTTALLKSKSLAQKIENDVVPDDAVHTIIPVKSEQVVHKPEKEISLGVVPEDKNELEKTFKVASVPKKKKKAVENVLSLEKTLKIKTKKTAKVSVKEIVKESIAEVFVNEVEGKEQVETPEVVSTPVVKINEATENTFPKSFFNQIDDLEDNEEEDDDFPANFSLKEKLTGGDRNVGRTMTSNKLFEIIKLRGDNVVSVKHLSGKESHCIINQKNSFCSVKKNESDSACLFFSEPLLNKINLTKNKKLETKKTKSLKSFTKRQTTYKAYLPNKGETTVSDGFYDYVLRTTYVADKVDETKPVDDIPLNKRILQSTAFRNASKAVIFHLVILVVLSFTIEIPDIEEFKNPETHFVVIDTENIHKPVKPKPKPKPIIRKKAIKVAKKKIKKQGTQVAALRKKPGKKVGKPKAGGGHKGNLINRNINQVGLLGALGFKTGIKVKSNEALAAVTNIDAITSTHSREAKIKIGGIVGSLGDGNIAIPTGGVFNSKGSTDVLRSAGIGGKGSIAALESGNTGQRAVAGTVSAPLTKKVRFKGGGISREAVAKVINAHIDEISYCYETSLIADPSLMGKVVFEWKILPSGKVGEVKIKSSSLRSSDIHSCIKSAIRTWRFPKPKGGAAIISYPFVFDVSGF